VPLGIYPEYGREMDLVEQIRDLILKESEGDLASSKEDLHVTIRIAGDFYNYLRMYEKSPHPIDVSYMLGTIRSGIDFLFRLIHSCVYREDEEKWVGAFNPLRAWSYPELRKEFLTRFDSLASPQLDRADRLVSLFILKHLELVYLAQNFPQAAVAGVMNGKSKSPEEAQKDFDETISIARDVATKKITNDELSTLLEAQRKKRNPQ
jgi:hypothetical protein